MNVEKNLGVVTAYGAAIQGGYEGTLEEFYEIMGNLPQYASRAETAAGTADEDVQTVLDAKDAAETAAQNASDSASAATTAAENAADAQEAAEAAQQAAEEAAASITTDDTLSITGKAADAKKTGDEISELKNDLDEISQTGISASGATEGQVPVANGEGGWSWGELGKVGDFEVAENYAALLTSTANRVLVLHNDSYYGNGGQCWYEVREGETLWGYTRADNSVVYPMASKLPAKESEPPIQALMEVLKTWIGNTNVKHGTANTAHYNTLFGETCEADSDGKFVSDCTTFIESVLLGITYDHSRYVLGTDKDNITGSLINGLNWPTSKVGTIVPKGGLQLCELAQWFAEQGQLYEIPSDTKDPVSRLQVGDILFHTDYSSSPNRYYGLSHITMVIGIPKGSSWILVAQSIDGINTAYEQTNIAEHGRDFADDVSKGKVRIFARPNWNSLLGHTKDTILPSGNNKYKLNCYFVPRTEVADGSVTRYKESEQIFKRHFASTPDYYPVKSGSVIEYTGAASNDRDNYKFEVLMYEAGYKFYGKTTIFASATSTPLTIPSTVKYVRFNLSHESGSGAIGILLKDLDDIEVTITPN